MKPDADSQQQTRLIVEKHNQRWAAGDLEGIFALYDPDMVLTDHYTSKSYTGAGLRKHITQVIQRSRLDSLTYTDAIRTVAANPPAEQASIQDAVAVAQR